MFSIDRFGTVVNLWLFAVTKRQRCLWRWGSGGTCQARWGSRRVSSPQAACLCNPPQGPSSQDSHFSGSQTADCFLTVKNINNKKFKEKIQYGTVKCYPSGESKSMACIKDRSLHEDATKRPRWPLPTWQDLEAAGVCVPRPQPFPPLPQLLHFLLSPLCQLDLTWVYIHGTLNWKNQILGLSFPIKHCMILYESLLAVFLAISMRIRWSILTLNS